MPTTQEVASQMIANLRVTDPELDTSVGSTTRKIIDAAAEAVAEASIDSHLTTYQYDIDSKIGADLDDFVELFGMARLPAKRASGQVTFRRAASTALNRTLFVPVNTTVTSLTSPTIAVQTVAGSYMEAGSTGVTVVVQAVEAGPSGNLPAETLQRLTSPIVGITQVTNLSPLTGGTHQETDSELRDRWKRTVFRNLAGTEQMYLGIALEDPDCYVATVVGSSKRRREQVQVNPSAQAITTVDDAAFVYPEPVFVGADIDAGDLFLKDIDYTWNTSVNPPRVDVIDSGKMPNGSIVEIDFEYQPTSSRNDPGNGIVNRVDVWVGGQRGRAATQALVFRTGLTFTGTSLPTTDPLSRNKFSRSNGQPPSLGNIFVPLAFGPVLTVPDTISIGGSTFALATPDHPMGTSVTVGDEVIRYAYRIVHDSTASGYGIGSRFGLEWSSTPGYFPANNSAFAIGGQTDTPYLYNDVIHAIQGAIERWRLLGVDVMVHQAVQVALRLSVGIVYEARANISAVNSDIDRAVAEHMTSVGFQSRVQGSDLLQVIHNVPGVDNVRFIDARDYSGFNLANPATYPNGIAIQSISEGQVVTTYADTLGRVKDIHLGYSQLPVMHSVSKTRFSETSFERGYLNS